MDPDSETRRSIGYSAPVLALLVGAVAVSAPVAHADNGNTVGPNNARLNNSVYVNIDTAEKQAGCTTATREDRRLKEAARRHALDALNHPDINGDIGSDGSTPQDRARDAGFNGKAVQTVATMPSLAINGIDILGQWWWDPPSRAKMEDCANTNIGVWSENSLSRSVLVAVYGQPA
jgi:hypothetical protein